MEITIMIRGRAAKTDGTGYYTCWSEIRHSWQAAWKEAKRSAPKECCHKRKVTKDFYYLDIKDF